RWPTPPTGTPPGRSAAPPDRNGRRGTCPAQIYPTRTGSELSRRSRNGPVRTIHHLARALRGTDLLEPTRTNRDRGSRHRSSAEPAAVRGPVAAPGVLRPGAARGGPGPARLPGHRPRGVGAADRGRGVRRHRGPGLTRLPWPHRALGGDVRPARPLVRVLRVR